MWKLTRRNEPRKHCLLFPLTAHHEGHPSRSGLQARRFQCRAICPTFHWPPATGLSGKYARPTVLTAHDEGQWCKKIRSNVHILTQIIHDS
jgi:hypothetical protein